MASCVSFDSSGVLYQTGESVADCTGYLLLDASEYSDFPTLQSIFQIPLAEDLAQLWAVGFSLPVIIYLSAWGLGVVINWFRPSHDKY